ncbi:MAG: putative sugar nucleotidyl transferase [Gemmataceae bacterium]
MRVCLFEDHGVVDLEPLTLTRPVFDLLCGASPLSTKQTQYFAPCVAGTLVRPFLAELLAERRPDVPVNDPAWLRLGPVVLVNGRWLPPGDNAGAAIAGAGPCLGMVGSDVAFAVLTPEYLAGLSAATLDSFLDDWKQTLPRREAGGTMIAGPWDLVDHNGQQLAEDFRGRSHDSRSSCRPLDLALVGPAGNLALHSTVRLDPLVVIDTTNGPVIVERDAYLGAFTRLEGPCYVGPGTYVVGAKVRGGTTIGPFCRVGGEVDASIIHGFSNKYHDGFLGHSYLGEWVNVGAGAQTSDLRHDYGEVVVTVGGLGVPTGQTKAGSYIGDHTKIGLGALLNTGTNIGVFAGVLPAGRLLPRYVPSFCAVSHGTLAENDDIEVLFATAEEVMRRRGVRLTEAQQQVYRRVYEQTTLQREQVLRDQEPRKSRRAA